MPRKAPSDSRFALRSKPEAADAKVDWAPSQRTGTVSVTSAPMKLADASSDDAEAASEDAAQAAQDRGAAEGTADVASAESDTSADATSELDALLASLGEEPAPADGGDAAAEEALDPELEALLKSLG
jgi:hypothetical protein